MLPGLLAAVAAVLAPPGSSRISSSGLPRSPSAADLDIAKRAGELALWRSVRLPVRAVAQWEQEWRL